MFFLVSLQKTFILAINSFLHIFHTLDSCTILIYIHEFLDGLEIWLLQ